MLVTKNAEDFEELPPMPYKSYWHCVAAIDENRIFVSGVGSGSLSSAKANEKALMFHKSRGQWESLPNMPTPRWSMGCGVVRDGKGGVEVVVVGGYVAPGRERTYVVEIFNVNEERWRTGSPIAITNAFCVTISPLQPNTPFRLQSTPRPSHSTEIPFIWWADGLQIPILMQTSSEEAG